MKDLSSSTKDLGVVDPTVEFDFKYGYFIRDGNLYKQRTTRSNREDGPVELVREGFLQEKPGRGYIFKPDLHVLEISWLLGGDVLENPVETVSELMGADVGKE